MLENLTIRRLHHETKAAECTRQLMTMEENWNLKRQRRQIQKDHAYLDSICKADRKLAQEGRKYKQSLLEYVYAIQSNHHHLGRPLNLCHATQAGVQKESRI